MRASKREHRDGISDRTACRIRHLRIARAELSNRIAEIETEPYMADTLVQPFHYRKLLCAALNEISDVISELSQPQVPIVALRRIRIKPSQMSLSFNAARFGSCKAPPPSPP